MSQMRQFCPNLQSVAHEEQLSPCEPFINLQGYHKGHVLVSTATVFDAFLKQVSSHIPGLDPQHFHIVIVCSRAGAPADARQHIPIHENTVSELLPDTFMTTLQVRLMPGAFEFMSNQSVLLLPGINQFMRTWQVKLMHSRLHSMSTQSVRLLTSTF